jgi:hypothetical protein
MDPDIHSPNPQRNLYTSYEHESYHRSAMPASDNQTVTQSAANASFPQGHGHALNLVGEMARRGSTRKGSSSPSQIPRACASPNKTTGSPNSSQSQVRAQSTTGTATTSKLSQSTPPLIPLEVEYRCGAGGEETCADGHLDLTGSGSDFLTSLQQTLTYSLELEMVLDRQLHCIHFLTEGDKPKKKILHLDAGLNIEDAWQSMVTWIQKHKLSERPQLCVVIAEKRRSRVT